MTAIHPTAIVDKSAELGADVEIGPYCIVGPNVKLGARTRLIAQVYIERETTLGEDNTVHPFAALGTPPQDTSYKGEPTKLIVGARAMIREHVSMHRGTMRSRGETVIGDDGFFMAQAHVAHDCVIGNNVILAQGATIGGHVQIGDHVIMGGLSAVHQNGRIGNHAFVGGLAAVVADVIPYGSVFGNHAQLAGLNVVGLKRRGFTRDAIHDLRAAYRLLFAEEGTFQERLDDVAELYAHVAEVREIVTFIRADAQRALCMPKI
ncbi:MAG: acyl-ACP--UDP-N-acetylglucosamine O-acyltransferase [Alphaproteobacteria bacterium]|nr:acyl-ACP--UDP-N-acetylglucosamine O-acyltransferase [Alphaproteobacteria bacterium]